MSAKGTQLVVEEGEQVSLTTTATYLAAKPGYHEVRMYTDEKWRIAHSPKILGVYYYLNSASSYTSYLTQATDKSTSTHVPLDAMGTSDYLYIGTYNPVLGFYFTVDATNKNDNAATLDWEYCSTALAVGASIAFTDVAGDSDGTDVAGDTLKQSGVYTFTLVSEGTIKPSYLGTMAAQVGPKAYWYRFKPSAALSATVDVQSIIPVYRNANYGYRQPGIEYSWDFPADKVGGWVLLTDSAASATLDVSWIERI